MIILKFYVNMFTVCYKVLILNAFQLEQYVRMCGLSLNIQYTFQSNVQNKDPKDTFSNF